MRRKAAASPRIVDTTIRTDASSLTMQRRLAANYEFAIGARQGVINNISDPSNTGTTSNSKSTMMTTKASGGRIPDASFFTAYLGGQALDKDGGPFQKPQRYLLNSNTAGSISNCTALDEPSTALPSGTIVGTIRSNTNQLSTTGTTLTVGVSPYTSNITQKNILPALGRSITISGALSSITINSISGTAPNMIFNVSSTAGLVASTTVVTITGATNSVNNVVSTTIGAVVANTSFALTIVGGIAEVTTSAKAGFVSPNNGTYTITSVISPYSFTVTNANAITDLVPTGTVSIPLAVVGRGANTVSQNAGQIAMATQACRYGSTEPHNQLLIGPPKFTNDILRHNKSVGIISTYTRDGTGNYLGVNRVDNTSATATPGADCSGVVHTHPVYVPRTRQWGPPRPSHGMGGIPVYTVSSPSDARKVGGYDYKDHQKYVEKHHGNDLNVNPRRVPTEFVPTNRAPAHMKINDPRHYPVA